MKVSVVIPNYNGKKFLDDCMEALSKQTMKEFEVIIVDNGSTDGSQAYIKEKFPSVVLIELQENTGFSGAVNVGIKAAKAKYVLLLNNDTKVFPDFVKQLYDAIRGNKRIFSVSSQMIKMYQQIAIDEFGYTKTSPSSLFPNTLINPDYSLFGNPKVNYLHFIDDDTAMLLDLDETKDAWGIRL